MIARNSRVPWRTRLGVFVLSAAATACGPGCEPPPADPSPTAVKAPGAVGSASGTGPGTQAASDPKSPEGAPPASDMIMEAKGVDTSKLSDAQRNSFFQVINVEPSACDKPHSIAQSIRDDASCRDSVTAAQFISDRIGAGVTPADVRLELDGVIKSLKPVEISIEGRAVFGNPRAPVTVIVFADFECPYCQSEAPKLRAAVKKFQPRAKLVYKHFPISGHKYSMAAAVATEAALAQGKFWEMHDKVFQNQKQLTDQDLERYAKDIDLDIGKFRAFVADESNRAAVIADRDDGEKIGIGGTPAVFVNGRAYNQRLFGGTFEGWIEDALQR